MPSPDELLAALERAQAGPGGPPVDTWDPPLSGDMDMVICADGTWLHEGDPIRRHSLVKLFASVLKREGDDYFLVTPVEKWRIRVEDLPFVAHTVEQVQREGTPYLLFTTNVDDEVVADSAHSLDVTTGEGGEPAPSLHVRRGLNARIGRNAFYDLVALAQPRDGKGGTELVVRSGDSVFSLGAVNGD
ncbi:MAG: DUF1285 domain-containing protein [Alcanivoracaceae bacterium]